MKKEQKKTLGRIAAVVCGVGLIVLILQAAGMIRRNAVVFPGAGEIAEAFLRLMGEGKTWRMIGTTALHTLEALAGAMVIGILIGIGEGISEWFHSFLKPLMTMIRSMPMIVLVIVIMVTIQYKAVPATAAAVLLIPMISEAVYQGWREIPRELTDVYRLNGGLSFTVVKDVYLPMISGYLKQAFINAAGTGLKVAVSAEYLVQAKDSLGKAIYSSSYFNEYAEIYAYALIMVGLILLITEVPVFFLRRGEE